MKKLKHLDIRTGNVVKYGKRKDLYVVADVRLEGTRPDGSISDLIEKVVLLDWSHQASTTHISRKHPFTKKILINQDCKDGECNCEWNDMCEYNEVPDPEFSIDAVKVVASTVGEFINKKLKKLMYD